MSQVLADGGLSDVEPELLELGMDARSAPAWIGGLHLPNQGAKVRAEGGPAGAMRPGLPAPGERERTPVPADDRVGRDDLDRSAPVGPESREQDPQKAIGRVEPRAPWRLTLKDSQLVPKGQDLHVEVDAGPDNGPESGD